MTTARDVLAGIKARTESPSVSCASVVRSDVPHPVAAVEAVLREHFEHHLSVGTQCYTCRSSWPCPTAVAITTELEKQ